MMMNSLKLLGLCLLLIQCAAPIDENQVETASPEPIEIEVKQSESVVESASIETEEALKEPWDLGCDGSGSTMEHTDCVCRSFGIADSVLQRLFEEQIYLLENSNCNDCLEGAVDRQIELAKERQVIFNKMLEVTLEYVDLEYEGGSIRPSMKCGQGVEMVVNQINEIESLLFPLRRAAG